MNKQQLQRAKEIEARLQILKGFWGMIFQWETRKKAGYGAIKIKFFYGSGQYDHQEIHEEHHPIEPEVLMEIYKTKIKKEIESLEIEFNNL
jgi:hypothetical protein